MYKLKGSKCVIHYILLWTSAGNWSRVKMFILEWLTCSNLPGTLPISELKKVPHLRKLLGPWQTETVGYSSLYYQIIRTGPVNHVSIEKKNVFIKTWTLINELKQLKCIFPLLISRLQFRSSSRTEGPRIVTKEHPYVAPSQVQSERARNI